LQCDTRASCLRMRRGMIVGVIVIAMYLPMFKLLELVQ